ncbi:PREDICTED: uncharacterized protein LOC109327683 [Lupinus angustifolius]|uniref:uncharacterized protein LOC109327683 n=1 Tax=Lupinus angustifolius TaxID=3871 RepID=UPI00092F9A03|nr:PREDICTED: uncharacterized protein LOC109327683 [Lupinus angustifolius]
MVACSNIGASQVQTTIFKFDGRSNFSMWKWLMELCLTTNEYGEIIKKGFVEPTEGDKGKVDEQQVEKDRMLNKKALFPICQSVKLTVLEKNFHAKTRKEAWEILVKTYEGVDPVKWTRLQGLKHHFELMEQGRDENIHDYFSRMDKLANEMKSNGDDIKEKEVVEKIMRTLSSRFHYVVAAIEEAKDLRTLSSRFHYVVAAIKEAKDLTTMALKNLQVSLESHKMRVNERSNGTFGQVLKAQTNVKNDGSMQKRENHFQRGRNFKGRERNPQFDSKQGARVNDSFQNKSNTQCHKYQKYGHFQSECKSHIQCHNCKKYCHYSRECHTKALNIRDSHAQVVETEEEMKMALTTCYIVATDKNENQWLLDTYCSNHLSENKELFYDLDENFHATIKLGDNSKHEVLEKGKSSLD